MAIGEANGNSTVHLPPVVTCHGPGWEIPSFTICTLESCVLCSSGTAALAIRLQSRQTHSQYLVHRVW